MGGPNNKDSSILGSILGSPILGNPHLACESGGRAIRFRRWCGKCHTHLPFLQGLFFVGLWDPPD